MFTSGAHCAAFSVNDASFITMVPLKAGGNTGCFARWHQRGLEQNQFMLPVGGKGIKSGAFVL